MLFDISHKMRAPLAKIKGIINIIKDDYPKSDDTEKLFDYLQDGTEELDSCLRSLNDEYQKKDCKAYKDQLRKLSPDKLINHLDMLNAIFIVYITFLLET